MQCVVAHWSTDLEAYLPQMIDPANRTRFTAANAPIVEFHGSIDGTINISHAHDAQAHYASTGVPYQLHILEGCAHGAWCYNGKTVNGSAVCQCSNGVAGYDDTMDTMALPSWPTTKAASNVVIVVAHEELRCRSFHTINVSSTGLSIKVLSTHRVPRTSAPEYPVLYYLLTYLLPWLSR